ncbi:ferric reductase [Betaproteobacteria bacterium]|nr:ferric reductase [Betaproteobacteria bacterium]GHU32540.1 ferric reductase [Betaproteobacteria bacterium]
MKQIKWTYGVLLVGLSLLWLMAEQPWGQAYTLMSLRAALVNYTGIIAMGAMSIAMMLAVRPTSVEPLLGGLDKSYRLHKWLGITALVLGIVHWLWAQGFKWAVGWGWLERPVRGARAPADGFFMQFVQDMHSPAEHWGEWASYLAAVLIVLALVKRFPYRYFFSTHRILAVTYLVLVFHSVVLIKFDYWQSPVAWVMALLLVGGTVGAVVSLTRRIGIQRRALGAIEALEYSTANQTLKVDIRLARDRWEGHAAGQFAFVTFSGDSEGAHPFTISSAWKKDGLLSFHIKELGDYTTSLYAKLKAGDGATVEGPYGCFHFESDKPRQIWIAGGIGITPFMARMEELAHRNQATNQVDLFYSTKSPNEDSVTHLRQLAVASGVTLHLIDSTRDGKLDAESLCQKAPAWAESSVWFCGPAGFGHSLRQGLAVRGFEGKYFHQELFDMR